MTRNKNGFTMIELIFVVVIIGILSAIALPKFFGVQNSAEFANAQKQIQAIRTSIQSEHEQSIQDSNATRGGGGGTLRLYYNFQPWKLIKNKKGKMVHMTYKDGNNSILMQNVSTFRFQAVGSLIKIQLCVSDANISTSKEYSICKEQTVF